MEEKIGIVRHVIHAKTNGFLDYTKDDGEEDAIYFSCNAGIHKQRHAVWLKGDKVKFIIEDHGENGLFAHITEFVCNDLYDELMQQLDASQSNLLWGRLKIFQNKLYFVERITKMTFFVDSTLLPLMDINPSRLCEAYYDPNESVQSVKLAETEYVIKLLRSRKRTRQPIMAIVSEITADYITVNIPNTFLLGRVTAFNKEHWYVKGDIIYVYFIAILDNIISFIERDYYVDKYNNNPFIKGQSYQAVVSGQVRDLRYAISIKGTDETGVLKFSEKWEERELHEGDELTVVYDDVTQYAEYMFLTPRDYLKKQSQTLINPITIQ